MFSLVLSALVMEIVFGLSSISSANLRILFGIVAENISVCLLSGINVKIFLISSKKPISSISSASSKTTTLGFILILPLSNRSCNLPGVATTIEACLILSICLLYAVPPYTVAVLSPDNLPKRYNSSLTCIASSLVGTITSPSTLPSALMLCIIGRPNAAVLPVPVCA